MMEMADYWILEKDLVPKLFKVVVPRFQDKIGPYTLVHKLPVEYPGNGRKNIVLGNLESFVGYIKLQLCLFIFETKELKDNQLPKIKTMSLTEAQNSFENSLTNVLLQSLKQDYKFNSQK